MRSSYWILSDTDCACWHCLVAHGKPVAQQDRTYRNHLNNSFEHVWNNSGVEGRQRLTALCNKFPEHRWPISRLAGDLPNVLTTLQQSPKLEHVPSTPVSSSTVLHDTPPEQLDSASIDDFDCHPGSSSSLRRLHRVHAASHNKTHSPTAPIFESPHISHTAPRTAAHVIQLFERLEEESSGLPQPLSHQPATPVPIPSPPYTPYLRFHRHVATRWKHLSISEIRALDIIVLFIALLLTSCNISRTVSEFAIAGIVCTLRTCGQGRIADNIPRSAEGIMIRAGLQEPFGRIAVCHSCWSLYDVNDIPPVCHFSQFPLHPHAKHREPCGQPMVDAAGHPLLTMPYQSIRHSLTELLERPNMLNTLHSWPAWQEQTTDKLKDIVDGRNFKLLPCPTRPGNYFFHVPQYGLPVTSATGLEGGDLREYRIGVVLNVDWAQPFRDSHSVGFVYLAVVNLHPSIRYLRQNRILVQVIPGPTEPDVDGINRVLGTLAQELQEGYLEGWSAFVQGQTVRFRVALVSVMCDLPAARKVAGFASYNAAHGCTYCTAVFPALDPDQPQIRNFAPSLESPSPLHSHDYVQLKRKEYAAAPTQAAQSHVVEATGIRFSILADKLPYFSLDMVALDAMHNLYLGIGRYVLQKLFIEQTPRRFKHPVLDQRSLSSMEQVCRSMHAPNGLGRLPHSFSSGFSTFKAAEMRTFIHHYSIFLFALSITFPPAWLAAWSQFVQACTILTHWTITEQHAQTAVSLLKSFFAFLRKHYGDGAITPNMHLATHYPYSIVLNGPTPVTWLFRFEQANGQFLALNNPGRNIPEVVMRAFAHQRVFDQMQASPSLQIGHESTLFTVLSKARQASHDATDLFPPAQHAIINLENPSPTFLDDKLTFDIHAWIDAHGEKIQDFGFNIHWRWPWFGRAQGETATSCTVSGHVFVAGKTYVDFDGSRFGGAQGEVGLLLRIFKVAGVAFGVFDQAVSRAIRNVGIHAEIVTRLESTHVQYCAFPIRPQIIICPLASVMGRLIIRPKNPFLASSPVPDVRGQPFFVVSCVPLRDF